MKSTIATTSTYHLTRTRTKRGTHTRAQTYPRVSLHQNQNRNINSGKKKAKAISWKPVNRPQVSIMTKHGCRRHHTTCTPHQMLIDNPPSAPLFIPPKDPQSTPASAHVHAYMCQYFTNDGNKCGPVRLNDNGSSSLTPQSPPRYF